MQQLVEVPSGDDRAQKKGEKRRQNFQLNVEIIKKKDRDRIAAAAQLQVRRSKKIKLGKRRRRKWGNVRSAVAVVYGTRQVKTRRYLSLFWHHHQKLLLFSF